MVKAYILINVKGGTEYELFEQLLELEGLIEISLVWGLFDLILKISAKSTNELDKLISEKIRKFDSISSTMTMIIRED
ncbi:MAG: Lrp/AsnC family transcriptional regulator [Candidatus Heimdallarchaeota archaeon]|nr:Lrp/AsnC family transcriptional regulator [Candidatus Heimdallarchaeota archaeon]